MAAWRHYATWSDGQYAAYRKYAQANAPAFRGRSEDCADLSISMLIDFAASAGLPLTFEDIDGYLYVSKGTMPLARNGDMRLTPWFDKEAFATTVRRFIQTKSLFYRNTVVSDDPPLPGDLMMRFSESVFGVHNHHTALVFGAYRPLFKHPKEHSQVKSFPGLEQAMAQTSVTEYFMGMVDKDNDWQTYSRAADIWYHFDYLNSRGSKKRNAELIYFAVYNQFLDEGFEFRRYAPNVLENWTDWSGEGRPPRFPAVLMPPGIQPLPQGLRPG